MTPWSPAQPLVVVEAMKMEHQVVAPAAGTVAEVLVHEPASSSTPASRCVQDRDRDTS